MKKLTITVFLLLLGRMAIGDMTSLYLENDTLHGTDAFYSHGTKLSYVKGEEPDALEFFIGQHIYTPSDKLATEVCKDDRPYAGWLYVGVSKSIECVPWSLLNRSEVSIGIIGPQSYAKETQIEIHRLINNKLPQGWNNQLEDEPALLFRHEIQRPFTIAENYIYLVPQTELCVGTVMDYLGTGCVLFLGYNPEIHMKNQITPKNLKRNLSIYGFIGGFGKAIAWNTFLDGNMYHESHSVDKEPFTSEGQVGIGIRYKNVALIITDAVRSREFKTQDEVERYDAMNMSVLF